METKIYLTNKELLAELNRAKASYCHFVDPAYAVWDAITEDFDAITPTFLADAAAARAKRDKTPATVDGLIIRVMTTDHIPAEYVFEGKAPRGAARLPFPAFKHYRHVGGELVEVGRSHWRDGLENGSFTIDKGRCTQRLATMWMMLAKRYSHRANFRNYSFRDDMKATAIMRLFEVGMAFNEARTLNPFAYWTTIVTHVYERAITSEQKLANLRDDMLIAAGKLPSMRRQMADEDAAKGIAPPPKPKAKRGRPRKAREAVLPL